MQEHLPLRHVRPEPTRGAGLRALALVAGGWVVMRAFFIIGDDGEVRLRPFPGQVASGHVAQSGPEGQLAMPLITARADQDGNRQDRNQAVLLAHTLNPRPTTLSAWPLHITHPAAAPATTMDWGGVERDYMGQLGPLFLAGSTMEGAEQQNNGPEMAAGGWTTPLWPLGPMSPDTSETADKASPATARFGLYAYLFYRPDAASGAAATTYGGSQLFVRAHWRPDDDGLGGRSMLYARVSRDVTKDGRAEFAIGGAVQPAAALPVTLHGERRVRGNGPDATAAFVSGGVSGVALPHNASLNAFAQGGKVWPDGGKDSAFFDGQASLTAPVRKAEKWQADAGVLIATGGQDSTARLDIGPVVTLSAGEGRGPVKGPVKGQVQGQVGWRFRIAGEAAPASGPAVTLSVGF